MTAETTTAQDRRFVVALLRQLQRLEEQQAEANGWFKAVEDEHLASATTRSEEAARLREELERAAPALRSDHSEHIDVPGIARLQFRTTKSGLRVADAAAALAWVEEHEYDAFVRVTRALNVAEFKTFAARLLASDGDLLPGVETTPETTTMTVQWKGR